MGKDRRHDEDIEQASLCDLKKQLKDKDVLEKYKELVRSPAYVCRKCGRSARSAANLCKPDPL